MKDFVISQNFKTRVSEQYRTVCDTTIKFFQEVVKFGALLNEVESFLGDEQCRKGSGLQGWLAENCPEINYKTAQGYKAMAAQCATMIGGGTQALACLQWRETVVDPASQAVVAVAPSFIDRRDALFDQVDSRRKLEKMWIDFLCAGRRAGRPAGRKADLSRKPDTTDAVTAARAVWSQVVVPADRCAVALQAAAKMLNREDVENALIVLGGLIDLLKARKTELNG